MKLNNEPIKGRHKGLLLNGSDSYSYILMYELIY